MTTDGYIEENKTETFKKGDTVIMIDCLEAENNLKTNIWECLTDSFKAKCGEDVVFLKDYSGQFSCKFLKKLS